MGGENDQVEIVYTLYLRLKLVHEVPPQLRRCEVHCLFTPETPLIEVVSEELIHEVEFMISEVEGQLPLIEDSAHDLICYL